MIHSPTALHVAAVYVLHHYLYGSLDGLIDTFAAKSKEFMHVVKIGRTHVQGCGTSHISDRKFPAGWKC
jgi:fumarate hydratase class II